MSKPEIQITGHLFGARSEHVLIPDTRLVRLTYSNFGILSGLGVWVFRHL